MDSATSQMLEAVNKRIAHLEHIKKLILEEFGSSNGSAGPEPSVKSQYRRKRRKKAKGRSQKEKLQDWLKANGPATRAEIIAGSGLPAGTVTGYLSAEKDLFENREGKWYAR